ncbi:MAG: hypothetical protein AAF907_11805 [Planctomycetota bacterium]
MPLPLALSRGIAAAAALTFVITAFAEEPAEKSVGPVPRGLQIDAYYQKYYDAGGIPVVASERVADEALIAAGVVIERMLETRPPLRAALIDGGARLAIIGKNEATTDLPEYDFLRDRKAYWDERARGFGGTPALPMTSAAEENVLGLKSDRYRGESILIHEFAHAVHLIGLKAIDETFDDRLERTYRAAIDAGLWEKTYARTNRSEYFAEGVQCYFDCDAAADPPNGVHNRIRTREQLRTYDPALFELIDDAFGRNPWRWTPIGVHAEKWPAKDQKTEHAGKR